MDRTAVEQERLRDYLTTRRLDDGLFAPGFVERVGGAKLAAIRVGIAKECGVLRTIAPAPERPGRYRVECRGGVLHAVIGVDEQGRIERLWLERVLDDRPRSAGQRLRELCQLVLFLLTPLGLAVCGAGALLAATRVDLARALVLGTGLLVLCWRALPYWQLSEYGRPVIGVLGLALLLVGAARFPGLPVGRALTGWESAVLVLVWGVPQFTGVREPRTARLPLAIANPLPGSRALVAQGGGKKVNHHAGHPEQAYALDVCCLGRYGARARGLAPRRASAYHAHGAQVAAPVAGTVVTAVDGYPDQPVHANPFESRPLASQPAEGNHLVLRTAADPEVVVVLAHLRAGSLLVAEGDEVAPGQLLAEVGNSGNTTEPHLHLHAEARTADGVTPVPLRLAANPGRQLLRGRRLDR
ncbi:M23 family metallopeptidase [Kitasatospora sp. LaBMicrA B282]|uniref:M23 family metallopeptidase n=1 Tax=Kitasatospora sp. LaBMicrA B282 TaxID=3420949 RepID=UPI003D118CBF